MRDSLSWSMSADITSPSRIHLHVEALKNVAVLVAESLLQPVWAKKSSGTDGSYPFPPETIGFLLCSLFFGDSGSENNRLVSLKLPELVIEDTSEPIVERYLRAVCKSMLPSNLHVILLRCEIANFLLSIPSEENDEDGRNLCLHLLRSDFISRFYPVRGSGPGDIEKVLACEGTDWSTLINQDEEGFFQKITSR